MWVHLLMGALLVSRLLHPLGMYAAPNTLQFRIGRVGGITITLRFTAGLRPDDPGARFVRLARVLPHRH